MTVHSITSDAIDVGNITEETRKWVDAAGAALRKRGIIAPPILRPYRFDGEEQLACDYANFSITYLVEGEPNLPRLRKFDSSGTDIGVTDMTDALHVLVDHATSTKGVLSELQPFALKALLGVWSCWQSAPFQPCAPLDYVRFSIRSG